MDVFNKTAVEDISNEYKQKVMEKIKESFLQI